MRELVMMLRRVLVIGALLLALAPAPLARAANIELLGVGIIPGNTSDGLVLDPLVLEDGTPHDRAGGLGSAIAYTGIGTLYIATPDRGPADGTTSYQDRYYLLDIRVAPGTVTAILARATLLTNEAGQTLTGSSAAFDSSGSPASRRFDPEGLRVSKNGTFFVSDEYGPYIYEFSATGQRLRRLNVPARFLIANPSAIGTSELPSPPAPPPGNTSGRQANRGMEGLAISPDGTKLLGIMQSPLIQDGALNAQNQRRGVNCRILEIDLATGATREFLYQLDDRSNGVNEILAINDHTLLVIERDGNAGGAAVTKKIFHLDMTGATEISGMASLPQTGLPPGVTPVSKALFIDLLDPAFALAGPDFPEKIEGLAFGPDLPDGRRLLLVTSDNDFFETQDTKIFA
ncbi:MAG TPA: esterase-like activity of phytase family protein, partial [Candidatus Methylomirabilis sp.]